MSNNSQYDEEHDHGDYYRDLPMNEPGNPDHVVRWVGKDKVVIVHVKDSDLINIDGELQEVVF